MLCCTPFPRSMWRQSKSCCSGRKAITRRASPMWVVWCFSYSPWLTFSLGPELGGSGSLEVHFHHGHNAADSGCTSQQLRDTQDPAGSRSNAAHAARCQVSAHSIIHSTRRSSYWYCLQVRLRWVCDLANHGLTASLAVAHQRLSGTLGQLVDSAQLTWSCAHRLSVVMGIEAPAGHGVGIPCGIYGNWKLKKGFFLIITFCC